MAVAIRCLVNVGDLQIEHARVLHETLFVTLLTYGSETMNIMEGEGEI